jgi:hypothetical protein
MTLDIFTVESLGGIGEMKKSTESIEKSICEVSGMYLKKAIYELEDRKQKLVEETSGRSVLDYESLDELLKPWIEYESIQYAIDVLHDVVRKTE